MDQNILKARLSQEKRDRETDSKRKEKKPHLTTTTKISHAQRELRQTGDERKIYQNMLNTYKTLARKERQRKIDR